MSWGNGVVKKLNYKVEKVWERYINVKLKKSHHNNNKKKKIHYCPHWYQCVIDLFILSMVYYNLYKIFIIKSYSDVILLKI